MKKYPCKDCIIKMSCNQYCFRYTEAEEYKELFLDFMSWPKCPDCGHSTFNTTSQVSIKFDFICQACHAHFKFRFFSNKHDMKMGLTREYYRHFTYEKVPFKKNIEVQTADQIRQSIITYLSEDKE